MNPLNMRFRGVESFSAVRDIHLLFLDDGNQFTAVLLYKLIHLEIYNQLTLPNSASEKETESS